MTEATKRLFVAVPLSDPVKSTLSVYIEQIKPMLPFRKWVHPTDCHITLQFLGDTPSAGLTAIAEAVQQAVDGIKPFTLRNAATGVFGRPAEPSILWLGIAGDLEQLSLLQKRISLVLEPLGFEPETRAFKPHVTLARSYSGNRPFSMQWLRDAPALSSAADDGEQGFSWTVDEIVIYESHLSRKPMYEAAVRIPLERE